MYARVQNITNLGGRRNYIKNKSDREEVVGFFDTAPDGFWKLLAAENRSQFERSINSKKEKARASEGREFVIGLPGYAGDQDTAKILAMQVKQKLGVECVLAIHKKKTFDDEGRRIFNTHAHVIFAERTLLPEPIHVEEKRAERTYYYDAAGKKCKKADAVKVTPKGTVLQKEHTRHFSDKINFFDLKTLEPLFDDFAKQFHLQKFDITKHFPQKKIGQNNPKELFIREYNVLVKEMNRFFDELDADGSDRPAKEDFCEKFSVGQRFSVLQTDDVRKKFEEYRRQFEMSEDVLKRELEDLLSAAADVEKDIEKTEKVLQPVAPEDFVGAKVARVYEEELENKYFCRVDKSFLEHLKDILRELREMIAAIMSKLHISSEKEKDVGADQRQAAREDVREI